MNVRESIIRTQLASGYSLKELASLSSSGQSPDAEDAKNIHAAAKELENAIDAADEETKSLVAKDRLGQFMHIVFGLRFTKPSCYTDCARLSFLHPIQI